MFRFELVSVTFRSPWTKAIIKMTTPENPYSPPQSDLTSAEERAGPPEYYVVSPLKMTVLYFITLGMYKIYWFYKNWSNYKKYHKETLWPVPRAIFAVFFVRSLFRHIKFRADKLNIFSKWDMMTHSAVLTLMILIDNILGRLTVKGIGEPYTDIAGIAGAIVIFFLLLRAQNIINGVCQDPEGASNRRFTLANYVWIVIGAIWWVLVVIGTIALLRK